MPEARSRAPGRVGPDVRVSVSGRAAWRLGALVGLVVLYLGAASLLSLVSVRVGFDLWSGIDPFLPPERRPFLGAVELAHRAFAIDALRQVFLAALVIGGAWWRDRTGWRRRLALDRERPNGMRPVALLAILLVWPVLHITWVTGTAELFGASFGQHVRLSPFMSQAAVAAWLAYLAILAPVAEELLLRGEAYARAEAALGPGRRSWSPRSSSPPPTSRPGGWPGRSRCCPWPWRSAGCAGAPAGSGPASPCTAGRTSPW